MEVQYYCPNCKQELEVVSGCGSVSYFCNKCKLLISKSKILTKDQLSENADETSNNQKSVE